MIQFKTQYASLNNELEGCVTPTRNESVHGVVERRNKITSDTVSVCMVRYQEELTG